MSIPQLVSTQNQPLLSSLPDVLKSSILSYCDTEMQYSMYKICHAWNHHHLAHMDSCVLFEPGTFQFFRDCKISIRHLPEMPPEERLLALLFAHAGELRDKTSQLFAEEPLNPQAEALDAKVKKIIENSRSRTAQLRPIVRIQDQTLYRHILTKRLDDSGYCSLIHLPNLVYTGALDPNKAEIQILIQYKENNVLSLFTISASDSPSSLEEQHYEGKIVYVRDNGHNCVLSGREIQAALTNQSADHGIATKNECICHPPITNEMIIALHEQIKEAETKYEEIIAKPALNTVADPNVDEPISDDDKHFLGSHTASLESIADLEDCYPAPVISATPVIPVPPSPAQEETSSLQTHASALLLTTIAFLANWVAQAQ